jgi:hypothetical protein
MIIQKLWEIESRHMQGYARGESWGTIQSVHIKVAESEALLTALDANGERHQVASLPLGEPTSQQQVQLIVDALTQILQYRLLEDEEVPLRSKGF